MLIKTLSRLTKRGPQSKKSPEFSKATELDELDTRYLIPVVRYGHNCDIDYLYSNILHVK